MCMRFCDGMPKTSANYSPTQSAPHGTCGALISGFKNYVLAATYSCLATTIGADGLNYRVRNENGCTPIAKPPTHNFQTTSTVGPKSDKKDSKTIPYFAPCGATKGLRDSHNSFREFCRRISTPRLHALLRFHLVPINVVISHEPHNDS